MVISDKEFKKFSKQIALKKIGINGQRKIFEAKILIIGVGGLGCPLLIYLINSGVRNIGIVDDDKIELSNLNRQILYNSKDIGKFKIDKAYKFIKKTNNNIKVSKFKERINKKNIKRILSKFDIICDGTDNFQTRYLINDFCLANKKILISAAISKYSGHIFNFNFKRKGPCFRCFMPEPPINENNCETDGIMPTVAGIAGTLQANEVIKTILNLKYNLNGKILIFDSMISKFKIIKLNKNNRCIKECIKK